MIFAKNLRDRLLGNVEWIERHIGDCVTGHLSRPTFLATVQPIIDVGISQQVSQVDVETRIAELAQRRLNHNDELAQTVDCVNEKVVHEARNQNLPAFEGIYLRLSCALLGRFFYIFSKKIGYIS